MKQQKFYDPGALNHRVTLESFTETPDGCGGTTVSWTSVGTIWACLRPMRTRSDLIAQQDDETNLHEIVIRYRGDVASGWRFTLGSRVFSIVTLTDPNERQRYLVCTTEEEGR